MTTELLRSLLDKDHEEHAGNKNIPFFRKIADSFGKSDSGTFWNSVIFLNLIPEVIGGRSEMHGWASHDLAVSGSTRLFDVLAKYKVEKLLVFSAKAWESLPDTVLERDISLGATIPYGFNTFVKAAKTIAFHLRHPQFTTPKQLAKLGEAVELAMKQSSSEFHTAIERAKQS